MANLNLKKIGAILGIAVAAISIYVAVFDIPWNLATGLAKKVDTDKLEQELLKLRGEEIKKLSDSLDKMENNVENILRTLNREIIPTINKAHDSIFVRIKEVEYITMTLNDSLSLLASTSSAHYVRELAQTVTSKLDSLENFVVSFYRPVLIDSALASSELNLWTYQPTNGYQAMLGSIDSLGQSVLALQKRIDVIYKTIVEEKQTAEK